MRAKVFAALTLFVVAISLHADLVVMQNGDRYNGKVLTITASNLVFQSEILGPVLLPRVKVANVAFGTNVVVSPTLSARLPQASATVASSTKTNTSENISATLRQLASHTNLIQKVREQFLGTASPEASAKFGEMLGDLTSGKMTIADLRAQAKDVADQLRLLQRESGEDAGSTAGLYLSILDRFLGETGSANSAPTNSTGAAKP
jgi:hypothetical protein